MPAAVCASHVHAGCFQLMTPPPPVCWCSFTQLAICCQDFSIRKKYKSKRSQTYLRSRRGIYDPRSCGGTDPRGSRRFPSTYQIIQLIPPRPPHRCTCSLDKVNLVFSAARVALRTRISKWWLPGLWQSCTFLCVTLLCCTVSPCDWVTWAFVYVSPVGVSYGEHISKWPHIHFPWKQVTDSTTSPEEAWCFMVADPGWRLQPRRGSWVVEHRAQSVESRSWIYGDSGLWIQIVNDKCFLLCSVTRDICCTSCPWERNHSPATLWGFWGFSWVKSLQIKNVAQWTDC